MKYRIKEYTNKYGTRVYQIQEKKWWGWKNADRYHFTHKHTLNEAFILIRKEDGSDKSGRGEKPQEEEVLHR